MVEINCYSGLLLQLWLLTKRHETERLKCKEQFELPIMVQWRHHIFTVLSPQHRHQINTQNKYIWANNRRVTRTEKQKFVYSPHMNRVSVNVNIVRSVVCGSEVGITLFCMLWTDGIINSCWGSCIKHIIS